MGRKILDTLLFLAVAAGCVLLTLALTGKENLQSPTTIYNFAFLGIMIILYLITLFGGFFRMAGITAYFWEASGRIDEMSGQDSLENRIQTLDTYQPLSGALGRFLQDIRRSQGGICDIEDYINEDETDSLIHKRLLDLVPDMLTSLGILGTFVGLVWGLRSFQPSTYETMTSSVASLVDGIKVAFMTSIYGLILSLVCSYSLRTGYQAMTDAMQHFLDRFHARLVPSAQLEAQNRLIVNQQEQSSLMRTLTSEFSDQVSAGFAANMAPTLERINEQLGSMMTSISTSQQMFLQDIVNAFVREMKSTFSTEFSQFSDTLNSVNEMTNRNMAFSQHTSQQLAEEMKAVFSKDERNMHAAVAEISAMQGEMRESVRLMAEQNAQVMKSYAEAQEGALATLSKSEKESARFWVACNQTMQNYLKEAANAYTRFEQANASSEKMLEAITEVYQKNEQVLEEHEQRMKELQQTQQAMEKSLEEIQRVFSQVEVAGSDGKKIILYPGLAARLGKESEQRIVKQMETMLTESEQRQGEALDAIRDSMKEMNDRSAKKGRWFS